jgi:hypothetical protein
LRKNSAKHEKGKQCVETKEVKGMKLEETYHCNRDGCNAIRTFEHLIDTRSKIPLGTEFTLIDVEEGWEFIATAKEAIEGYCRDHHPSLLKSLRLTVCFR